MNTTISGYSYGQANLATSPIDLAALDLLNQSVLFTDDDARYLRMAGDVLADQVDAVLDVWYGFVAAHPHLVAYFSTPEGTVLPDYLARVRGRFGQWILDTTNRPYDQDWLNYQFEIGLRHHSTKKNATDNADSVDIIPLRYLVAFIYPITATIKPFLANKNHSADDVEKMYQAWFKSVVLHVILWSYPYINAGEF